MSDEDLPEPDRAEGAPHPRHTARLFGQSAAEEALLEARTEGRFHHAWLVTGPQGIGKATLAWRAARFLLASEPATADAGLFGAPPPPDSLDIDPAHPVARRMAALAEPRLMLIRRGWDHDRKRLRSQITVEETRKLNAFFGLSAADGGERAVIVDAADEMNPSAANALLKLLEEPPARTTLFLIAHRPNRLLPTIRSRCRELRLSPLGPEDLAAVLAQAGVTPAGDAGALAALAAGSAGEAIALTESGGLDLYARIVALMASLPRLDRAAALAFAESAAGKRDDAQTDLAIRLILTALSRLAVSAAGHPPQTEAAPAEAETFARLGPGPHAARAWAALAQTLTARTGHARGVNLDPSGIILDMVLKMSETAGQVSGR